MLDWEQIIVEAEDPERLGRWWAEALGWVVTIDDPHEFEIRPTPTTTPGMIFTPVTELSPDRGRVHPDFRPDDHEREVRRFLELGARRADIGQGDVPWEVMLDPEGNLFCILGEAAGPPDLAPVLAETYGAVTATAESLADDDFDHPTRAAEWTVRDLLFHQSLDAVRALAAFASTTTAEPDVDAVSYWRAYGAGSSGDEAGHAAWVRRSAAAFPTASLLVDYWRNHADAAVRAARAADRHGHVETQGHVLAVPDLLSTLVVEATIHLLDLAVDPPRPPSPPLAALAETRRVLDGLYGGPLPPTWDDTAAALKATGREPLDAVDHEALGDGAARLPLLS